MITIFHVFGITAAVAGCSLGILFGSRWFGWPGGVIGAPLGWYVGWVLGWLPATISFAVLRRALERSDVATLKRRLETEYFISHLIIAQLMIREEPVDDYREYILSLLHSDLSDQRRFGWLNLRIWFPELASRIEDFDPDDPTSECRKKLESLNKAA